nr:hypothetical protein [Angustibacter aerolatus]
MLITPRMLDEHVDRLGEKHPPIELDSVDRTVLRPDLVREQYGHVIDFMSRVELEVDRNVLEPADPAARPRRDRPALLPGRVAAAGDRARAHPRPHAAGPRHAPSQPELERIGLNIRVLGALAHLRPIQEVARLMYYLTGAATERSAVLAYNRLSAGLERLGEKALARTAIAPIKRQEPGHFAFYRMSATAMLQQRVLAPWQLRLVRTMRKHAFQPGRRVRQAAEGPVRRDRRGARPRGGPRGLRPRHRRRRARPALGPARGHARADVRAGRAARRRRGVPRAPHPAGHRTRPARLTRTAATAGRGRDAPTPCGP